MSPRRKAKMDGILPPRPQTPLRVCELFAGVGGFHLGLAPAGMKVLWANQWEPGAKTQHAFDCYERHFPGVCVNEDIGLVIDKHQRSGSQPRPIPEHDLLVGGFPCQDYSVAKPLSQAAGIDGKKGVLWWHIERWLYQFRPAYLFLENVDRLTKSPSNQRGRDFAIMLSCLARLGYEVEWRVINAADYGFAQKRRRVFIVGRHSSVIAEAVENPYRWMLNAGIFAEACPVTPKTASLLYESESAPPDFCLDKNDPENPYLVTKNFGKGASKSAFLNAGYMRSGDVWTLDVTANHKGKRTRLGQVLQKDNEVRNEFWVSSAQVARWKYLKGAKAERRIHPKTGFEYFYSEGGIPFPDAIDGPARTILTGEGGATPSRFKHIIEPNRDGRYRRLTPIELERVNGFPDDWTKGMPDGRRAFCMGNALVVGLVERIGRALARRAGLSKRVRSRRVIRKRRAPVR